MLTFYSSKESQELVRFDLGIPLEIWLNNKLPSIYWAANETMTANCLSYNYKALFWNCIVFLCKGNVIFILFHQITSVQRRLEGTWLFSTYSKGKQCDPLHIHLPLFIFFHPLLKFILISFQIKVISSPFEFICQCSQQSTRLVCQKLLI